MPTFEDPACRSQTLQRIGRLTPESGGRWGRMTARQMVCHLGDSYEMAAGERPATDRSSLWTRTWVKWRFLHVPLPWPRGLPTSPGNDPERGGTRSTEFESDRARLVRLLEVFVSAASAGKCPRHPLFGPLTSSEWLRWGYRHADHHLRQFGV